MRTRRRWVGRAPLVELHVEQGRGLADADALTNPWPWVPASGRTGRWRVELPGEANHAGTTALDDRHDAMLGYARLVLAARASAGQHSAVATCGKVQVKPNGVVTQSLAGHGLD